jgi:nucleotide-binding universal stress UspA family protein
MFKNVLVGADDSATALRAVGAAVEVAEKLGAKLHIVTAYLPETVLASHLLSGAAYGLPTFPNLDDAAEDHSGDTAEALLARLGQLAKSANVEAEFHAVTGPPAEAIVQAASRLGADLIIVGNKGMRGAKRVLGSIPNSIAHHAQCSVLIVDTTEAD